MSFLDGVSSPEELVEQAVRLDLDAVVLTDHDGMYGAVRFAQAARAVGLPAGYGAELSLDLPVPRAGQVDPAGTHLLVLAGSMRGYHRLCEVISRAQLAGGEKGRPVYAVEEVVEHLQGHVRVLTGCRKGAVRRALTETGPRAAAGEVRRLVEWFGRDHVVVELFDHGTPTDALHNDVLAGIADEVGVVTVASANAHYAHPGQARQAEVVAAIRARRSLEEIAGWLPAAGASFLRSGRHQARRFERRYPGAVGRAALLGVRCALDLSLIAPGLPHFPLPPGFEDEAAYLRHVTSQGAARRYGPSSAAREAYAQLDHELRIITELGFAGYFLVVWEIIRFCRAEGILAQGRGSAANSAVCYALDICHADPVRWNLLFERFLSPHRDGPPDIDIDIESDRRDEVIAHVYATHGRHHAAQVAAVITYRPRSAVRDAARALGHTRAQCDTYATATTRWRRLTDAHDDRDHGIPPLVLETAAGLEGTPRHLGVHSGGMVLSRTPLSQVVPVEWATAAGRTVVQWDKDDCATVGMVKFDLLGLGMLSALRYTLDLIATHHRHQVELGALDLADARVYDMLCAADAVGVFQLESRAQLGTLPRLRPRRFYDLAVEVALIRPGPIQGGSVHPYLRRRAGTEPWTHPHPLLAPALDRTLGVPLFQEQVMQLARDVASFTPAEADQLRQAMTSTRSADTMAVLRERFFTGAAGNGVPREVAVRVMEQIAAFSGYGFPEAHAISFALLVYASAWCKRYFPAAFLAGLLRAQPMGFYAPNTLVADARRHGIRIRHPTLARSGIRPTLEPDPASTGGMAVRLGLAAIRHCGSALAGRIVAARAHGRFTSLTDLTRRVSLSRPALEALATAGALDCWGWNRRQALWATGIAAAAHPGHLPGLHIEPCPPRLPEMSPIDLARADLWATGITPAVHPVYFARTRLEQRGAIPLDHTTHPRYTGRRVLVGGTVTHLQRPSTAGGTAFLNLEDDTGMLNIIISPGLYTRTRATLHTHPTLLIRGTLQHHHTPTLNADHITPLPLPGLTTSTRIHH